MVGNELLAHERLEPAPARRPRVVTVAGVLAMSATLVPAAVAAYLLYTQVVVYLLWPGSLDRGEEDPVVRVQDDRDLAVVMAVVGLVLLALAAGGVLGGVNSLRGRPSGLWLTVVSGTAQLVLSGLALVLMVGGLVADAHDPTTTAPPGPGLLDVVELGVCVVWPCAVVAAVVLLVLPAARHYLNP